jgi:hypothetical protein
MRSISRIEFAEALKELRRPDSNVLQFLKAHNEAPGRVSTATVLAASAGYQEYRGVNLQYGILAKRIGTTLGEPEANIELLIEIVKQGTVTNAEALLVMRCEFAQALADVGWI